LTARFAFADEGFVGVQSIASASSSLSLFPVSGGDKEERREGWPKMGLAGAVMTGLEERERASRTSAGRGGAGVGWGGVGEVCLEEKVWVLVSMSRTEGGWWMRREVMDARRTYRVAFQDSVPGNMEMDERLIQERGIQKSKYGFGDVVAGSLDVESNGKYKGGERWGSLRTRRSFAIPGVDGVWTLGMKREKNVQRIDLSLVNGCRVPAVERAEGMNRWDPRRSKR
jgi:hypothetical protein